MIIIEKYGSADNNDILSGTALESIPNAGLLTTYASSTLKTTTIEITGYGQVAIVRDQAVGMRADAEIRQNQDVAYMIPVRQGTKYNIAIKVAGQSPTWHVRVIYNDASEL